MYDIVYSITFHQKIDFVNHFLKNIEKYNSKNRYLVIIHLSNILYKNKKNIYSKNVIINPTHYDKKLYTHLLLKPFIENFEHLVSQKIQFNNFMTLSSSNRLVRQAPKFNQKNTASVENKTYNQVQYFDNKSWYWWPKFFKNKKILKIFQEHQIKLISGQVSGRLYPKNIMAKVCEFIRKNKIMSVIENEVVFEEILLPSLAKHYMSSPQKVYCHTFWNKLNVSKCIPTPEEVEKILKEKKNVYIIKRFPADLNHALYNGKFWQ